MIMIVAKREGRCDIMILSVLSVSSHDLVVNPVKVLHERLSHRVKAFVAI